ncbi:MAG: hypothetical protein HQK49_19230 [Oligoflexia bacterium]|nr:hypothetical protein [Oligoflexia bacterium]
MFIYHNSRKQYKKSLVAFLIEFLIVVPLAVLFINISIAVSDCTDEKVRAEKVKKIMELCERGEICNREKKGLSVYRFGEGKHERERIGKIPAFDISNVNFSLMKAGRGLYASKNIVQISEYNHLSDPEMVEVNLAPDSLVLTLSKPNKNILEKNGLTEKDVYECDPPVTVEYKIATSSFAYVFKDPKVTSIKNWDAENMETNDLVRVLSNVDDYKTREFLYQKAKKALSKHKYDPPNEQSKMSSSQLCSNLKHEIENSFTERFNELFEKNNQNYKYLWHYDGSCNQYTVSSDKKVQFTKSDVSKDLCRMSFETISSWSFDGNCYEVVKSEPNIRVEKLPDNRCNKLPIFCDISKGNRGNKYFISDLRRPDANFVSGVKFFTIEECEKRKLFVAQTGLNCTVGDVCSIVPIDGILPSNVGKDKSLNNIEPDMCDKLLQSYREDLKLICSQKSDKNYFIIDFHNHMDPQYITTVGSFTSLEACSDYIKSLKGKSLEKIKTLRQQRLKEVNLASSNIIKTQNWDKAIFEIHKHLPSLSSMLKSSAQVKEGYTVEEHSKKVFEQFESQLKYFETDLKNIKKMYPNIIPLMRSIIILHDIGKSLGPTNYQHKYTHPILTHFLKEWGYSEKEIKFAEQLITHDDLGEMLQGRRSVDNVDQSLRKRAKETDLTVQDFLKIQSLFYISDASSYPELLTNQFIKQVDGELRPKSKSYDLLIKSLSTDNSK